MHHFSQNELNYYTRHLVLDQIGITGQQKLKEARVLCIGAGGLGSPLLLYLAGAGVGTLGVIDHDVVEVSNLHRQVLYSIEDVGKQKAEAACAKIKQLNPYIQVQSYSTRLTVENASEIISSYDVIADCTDNFTARYLINDICFDLNKPNVQASISQFEGFCSVFTALQGPCYRCLFDMQPSTSSFQNCAQAGVLGVLPGLIGSIQAMEVIKLIVGIGQPLVGRLLKVNALSLEFSEFSFEKSSDCVLCSKLTMDPAHKARDVGRRDREPTDIITKTRDQNVGQRGASMAQDIRDVGQWRNENAGITAEELKAMQQKQPVFILDVREPHEYAHYNIGGYLIPLQQLPHRLSELNQKDTIVVHCRTNPRSHVAYDILKQAGFESVFCLEGGIEAFGFNSVEKVGSPLEFTPE